MRGELAGRHALVTGASRGIGRVIAAHLASQGAQVSVHGRDTAALAAVTREIAATGGRCQPVAGDLTTIDQPARVVDEAEASFGGVDVLVANAGGSPAKRSRWRR